MNNLWIAILILLVFGAVIYFGNKQMIKNVNPHAMVNLMIILGGLTLFIFLIYLLINL